MAATHEYSCVIWLRMPIDYQNVLIVNFARGQKVVPAGWLVSADGLENSLNIMGIVKCLFNLFIYTYKLLGHLPRGAELSCSKFVSCHLQ